MKEADSESADIKKTHEKSVDLIDHNLTLSYEQRLVQHQNALDTINELIRAREQLYGESQSSTQTPS